MPVHTNAMVQDHISRLSALEAKYSDMKSDVRDIKSAIKWQTTFLIMAISGLAIDLIRYAVAGG